MRTVKVPSELARALGELQACTGDGEAKARVRIQDLEAVEAAIGFRLPDPIIAYVAAGASAWGDGPVSLAAIPEATLDVVEQLERHGAQRRSKRFAIIDDDSSGNYIAVLAGADVTSTKVCFLDHEEGYRIDGAYVDLFDAIDSRLDGNEPPSSTPFKLSLYDEPYPAPIERWVSHAKFGRGKVLRQSDDVVTVLFDGAGEKRLKRSFLTFE